MPRRFAFERRQSAGQFPFCRRTLGWISLWGNEGKKKLEYEIVRPRSHDIIE